MAIPLITNLPPAPSRLETEETFVPKADALLGQLPTFVEETNTSITGINNTANQVTADKATTGQYLLEAETARDAAIASAVYKGTWEGKTSAGVIGESYSYQGSYIYRLNVNLANISTSEPSPTNTDWQLSNVVPFEAPCKPTLDLDFGNQDFTIYDKLGGFVKRPLADIVSQGRATAGTSTDAIGGVTEFAAGENRFTFDGETGEALGYLSEESRTNLLTNSEFPNGLSDAPSKSTLNLTLSSIDIGNGTINALAFGYDGVNDAFAYKTNYTTTSGQINTFSVFVEMTDGLPPSFTSSSPETAQNDLIIYMGNQNSNPLNYMVKRHYGNIYKVSATLTANASVNVFGVRKRATNSPRTFKVTGYQIEVGSFPTSYIRTLGAPVTRGSDSMTRTLGQEWNPNEGTFVVEFDGFKGAINSTVFGIYSLGFSNYLHIAQGGVEDIIIRIIIADVGVFNESIHPSIAGKIKIALSLSPSSLAVSVNGNPSNYFVIESNMSAYVKSSWGSLEGNLTSSLCLYSKAKYYPRAFDALTLQRLSRIQ